MGNLMEEVKQIGTEKLSSKIEKSQLWKHILEYSTCVDSDASNEIDKPSSTSEREINWGDF